MDDMGEYGAFWIAFDAEDRLIATAGYKPWDTHWKTLERIKTRKNDGERDEAKVKDEVVSVESHPAPLALHVLVILITLLFLFLNVNAVWVLGVLAAWRKAACYIFLISGVH